jgi:hypothetical protein
MKKLLLLVLFLSVGPIAHAGKQIVLLRTFVSTNHVPAYTSGSPPKQSSDGYSWSSTLECVLHPPTTVILTNYVLGFKNGTNCVELITLSK